MELQLKTFQGMTAISSIFGKKYVARYFDRGHINYYGRKANRGQNINCNLNSIRGLNQSRQSGSNQFLRLKNQSRSKPKSVIAVKPISKVEKLITVVNCLW